MKQFFSKLPSIQRETKHGDFRRKSPDTSVYMKVYFRFDFENWTDTQMVECDLLVSFRVISLSIVSVQAGTTFRNVNNDEVRIIERAFKLFFFLFPFLFCFTIYFIGVTSDVAIFSSKSSENIMVKFVLDYAGLNITFVSDY